MKILLDTCEFLWLINDSPRLSAQLRASIQNPEDEIYLSVVSLWEIIVKHALGKLPLPQAPADYIPKQRELHGILSLGLSEPAVQKLQDLPQHHRDPFDRMLVCQALNDGLTIASSDPNVHRYPVELL